MHRLDHLSQLNKRRLESRRPDRKLRYPLMSFLPYRPMRMEWTLARHLFSATATTNTDKPPSIEVTVTGRPIRALWRLVNRGGISPCPTLLSPLLKHVSSRLPSRNLLDPLLCNHHQHHQPLPRGDKTSCNLSVGCMTSCLKWSNSDTR